MNELKEILQSFQERIKSPYFGYIVFSSIAINWKSWFYLIVSNTDAKDRIRYFEDNTSINTLIYSPILIGLIFAVCSPWFRLAFTALASYPTARRNLIQAKSESALQIEKNKLKAAESEALKIEEEDIIGRATRDEAIRQIEDEELQDSVKEQIETVREHASKYETLRERKNREEVFDIRFLHRGGQDLIEIENIGNQVALNVKLDLYLDSQHGAERTDSNWLFDRDPKLQVLGANDVQVFPIATDVLDFRPKFFHIKLTWTDVGGMPNIMVSRFPLNEQ